MSFETSDKFMQSFQAAVMRAINIGGPNILENKHLFLNIIEDLVPYHENDYKFLKKTFDMDIGSMLKAAFASDGQEEQYYNDVLIYLLEEVGLSEKKANQFMSYFAFLKEGTVVGGQLAQNGSNSNKMGTLDSSNNVRDSVHSIEKRIEDDLEKGNVSRARELFEQSEGILISSEYYSYICLLIGESLEEIEPSNAMIYLSKAATKGNSRAMFLLGYMYENGEGVPIDLAKAASYYKAAADNGNRSAQHNLGCFYYLGNGLNKNYQFAFEYFLKAAQQGKADSMKNVGVMYELGQHVAQNYQKALEWYKKARENGDCDAGEYYRLLEKKLMNSKKDRRVLFRVLNKDAEKKDLYINVGEEIRGRSFSEHLSAEPIFKLLYNENTKQVGIKNMSDFEWNIVKMNNSSHICLPNKVVAIETGDMIKIINRVVQLNVISMICD